MTLRARPEALHVAVIGGSVGGLAVALACARDGHRVTLLERDAEPLPPSPGAAFASWPRRGAPQLRHSHAFLARLVLLLHERAPELLDAALAQGAEPLRFRDVLPPALRDAELLPEDEDLTLLACRRTTFEWVLRHCVERTGRARFEAGAEVTGLEARRDAATGLPRVTGVRLRRGEGGETLAADLVVDASGRRSKLVAWLQALGARAPRQESEPCGIFYSSRFYRLREGAVAPRGDGTIGADLGYMKYGIFPGDAGVFSITLAASPEDAPLRAVLRPHAFGAAAAALPATRAWVDPAISEPISRIFGMGKLANARCFPVDGGEPVALGVVPVGDALVHTNPLYGRGCTLAFVNAFLLADALRAHPADPRAFALALDAAVEREIVPWYHSARTADREAIALNAAQRRGEDPYAFQRPDGTVDPRAWMRTLLRDGLFPAMRSDLGILRTFARTFNLLDPPEDLMSRPALMQVVLSHWTQRHEREPIVQGPPRQQMLDTLAAA